MTKALAPEDIDEVFKRSRQYFFQDGMTLPTTLSDHYVTTPRDNAEQDHAEVFESRFADADDVDIEYFENEEVRRQEEDRRLRWARHEADLEEALRKAEELEAARQRQRLEDLSDEKIFAAPKGPINDKDGRIDLDYDDDGEPMMKGATNRPGPVGVHANNPGQSSEETARSRRRKMLETELTESLRNKLLLERRRREQAKADAEGARGSVGMQDRGRSDDGRTKLFVG